MSLADQLTSSIKNYSDLPSLPESLDLEQAYLLQHQVTSLRAGDQSNGIKAGVTEAAAQGFFGIDHPLIATLYEDGKLLDGAHLPYKKARLVECEIALIVDSKGAIKAMAPAFEIVFLNFSKTTPMNAVNLVACNLGADHYLLGDFQPWDAKLADTKISLTLNGKVVNTAHSSQAIGGPFLAAQWVISEASKRGFDWAGDKLILTGACGKVLPAEPGEYVADYGALGSICLTIEP